jgi:hypothetical protein
MTEQFKFMEFSELEDVIYNMTPQNTRKNTKWSVNTWDALQLPNASYKSSAKRSRRSAIASLGTPSPPPPTLSQRDELSDNELLQSVKHIESDDSVRIQQNH